MTASHHLGRVLRHPALIFGVYILRLLAAVGLSWNWATILGTSSVMAYPRKDSELFAPGAALLLRIIAQQQQAISRLAGRDLLFLVGIAVAGSALSGVAMSVLAKRNDPSESSSLGDSLRTVPRMLGISAVYWFSLIAALILAKILYLLIPVIVYPGFGEKGSDFAILLLFMALLVLSFMAFVASDLARAIAIQSNCGALEAVARSIDCLKRQFGKCLTAAVCWTTPAIVGPVIVEYGLTAVGLEGPIKTTTLVLVHQLVILALCLIHLGWWSKAIDLVRSIPKRYAELSQAGNL